MITHLTKDDFDAAVSEGRSIVDFWAEWCGPCKIQAQILDEFDAKRGETDGVRICKVDVEAQPELARRFRVMSIPTVMSFSDGEPIDRRVGVQDSDALEAMVFGSP